MRQLTKERWERLAPILDEALDLSPAARAAYLDQVCGGDIGLRVEVDALLRAHDSSADFLEDSVEAYLDAVVPQALRQAGSEQDVGPQAMVGPYRLVRELAHGGMGAVYLAERADGQFEQQVALKLIRRGMDSDEIRRRFVAERQILASLSHPNVARLLDGGITPDGRPWFAMEYVDGSPLVTWCDSRRLDLAQRITLFAHVCDAVRYAHRNLVVHRDLKPSNVLVTADGSVKLLDFGIAKLLESQVTDESGAEPRTRTDLRILTPEYAAPEQVLGEAITTATDVYALGAVLYELLTGHRAHRFERHTPAEVERVVCDVEPELPSVVVMREVEAASATRGVRPERLRRALRGDLDTIVGTALRKDSARRYASVDAMLDDLGRYQAGLPIKARPDALGYRTRKFLRRHRVGVGAGAALALALVVGLGATVWQARAKALEAAKAREVKDFLVSLFQVSDPAESRGTEITARALLERGVQRVDSSLGRQPEVQEELLSVLGKIYRELGLYDQADTLLRRSVTVASHAYGPTHPEVAARLTEWGSVLRAKNDLAPAESVLRLALRLRHRRDAPGRAGTISELASTMMHVGNLAQAESLYRVALALDVGHFGPGHLQVATDLDNLGVLLGDRLGLLDRADSAYRAGLAIRRKLLDPGHPSVLNSEFNLSANLQDQGRFAESESLKRVVLAGYRRLFPDGDPNVASSLHALATLLEDVGRYAEAESTEVEALELRRRLLGPRHSATLATLNNVATTRYRMGDLPGAENAFREVVEGWRGTLGSDHPWTLSGINNLGFVLVEQGKYAEGERLLREAMDGRLRMMGDTSQIVGQSYRNLGVLLHHTGRRAEAERYLRQALAIYRKALPDQHPRTAEALTALGQLLTARGSLAEAEQLLREALAIREARFGLENPRTDETRQALGLVLAAEGRRGDAEPLLLESCERFSAGPWSARQARECRAHLTRFYREWGRPQEAAKYRPAD